MGVERNLQFVDASTQIEGEKEPNIENITTEKQLEMEKNPHIEPMDIDEPEPTGPRHSKRLIELTEHHAHGLAYDEVNVNIAFFLTKFNGYYSEVVGDPVTYKDVLKHPLKREWEGSMQFEINTLEDLNTWIRGDEESPSHQQDWSEISERAAVYVR